MLDTILPVPIRTTDRVAEIGWFCDLCGGDTEFLGQLDPSRRSSFEHCKNILLTAEAQNFKNILLPTSYVVGQEPIAFASAVAQLTSDISLLVAIRTGENHPPMLARAISTLDHLLEGRLTVNIINSDLPGYKEDGPLRYQRCTETIDILRQGWTQERIIHDGPVFGSINLSSAPVKPYQQHGGPLLYFGGIADGAREVCARQCDVFLMWPEKEESIYATMQDVSARAARHGRTIDFGLRIHVVVRETEAEARAYTRRLMSKFDAQQAEALKQRTQDANSLGVVRQNEMRKEADDEGFVEPILWTGIGRARSGAGGALVGTPEQIMAQLNRYMDMGIRSFIFSGYPLIEECEYFGKLVLPHLPNVRLADVQGRRPAEMPATPLTYGSLS
ncbi:LLM class flavin-dependent oxidoreductase [Spirosoma rigui]|uniref:LLM class flavin-dependent oxidoreductase n=1 Tax=Spirosoma rigui TaxID=564064 RepID=UPI0012D2CC81|nr:LLM class flavin-dependent oxidoreductase [Spirosoma rigui]